MEQVKKMFSLKAFSVAMVLAIALFVGNGQASAATWEVMSDSDGVTISVDKDSIRRGTDSKRFPKFSRKDGFSAIVKIHVHVDSKDVQDVELINLVSFYEKDGKRMYCLLDSYGEDKPYPETESDVLQENVDTDGDVWAKVWDYATKNLK